MDEAEYCHRIGLMVDGRLVALDTPAGLKKTHVPGRVLALEGDDVEKARRIVLRLDGVFDAQPFGTALHVRIDPTRIGPDDLAGALSWEGLTFQTESIEPTLEDVFLAVVEAK